MNRTNIFYGLINNENQCTELLCNMLKYKEVMDVFKSVLAIDNATFLDYTKIETRRKLNGEGFPDFQYYDENIALVIEVKTRLDAGLTPHQPESYIETLKNNKQDSAKGHYIFLIPSNYRHLPIAKQRIEEYEKNRVKIEEVEIKLVFWEEFVNKLNNFKTINKTKTKTTKDKIISNYIKILNSMFPAKEFDIEKINPDNLKSNELLKSWRDISGIVDSVYLSFKKEFGEIIYTAEIEKDFTSYGFNIRKNGNICLWFGMWMELWEKSGHTLAVYSNAEEWECSDKLKVQKTFKDYGFYAPLTKVEDKSEIISECLKLIKEYL